MLATIRRHTLLPCFNTYSLAGGSVGGTGVGVGVGMGPGAVLVVMGAVVCDIAAHKKVFFFFGGGRG